MPSISIRAAVVRLTLLLSTVAAEPVVQLSKGYITYHGTTEGPVEHFHNIRYGHDTSGLRRFAPPEPYIPAEGSVLDATTPGPACPQSQAAVPPVFAEVPEVSEDCLNLRISRPAGVAADERLPVVAHIYTGGLVRGNAEDPHWDPTSLLALSRSIGKPILYVALNFRLGMFGYARLPILKDQNSLNVGMRDQRVGLQWVRDNIAAFGGDPDRITAFGLSAGGTMASLHLTAYGGERGVPFTQAWSMSGPPGTALNITSGATEAHTRAVAEQLDCGHGDDEQVLECLRRVPVDRLTEVAVGYSVNHHPPMGLFTFTPSVDGDILPDRQSVLYRSGRFVKGVPLVLGWAQDDGATNAGPAALFPEEEDMKAAIRNFAHRLTEDDLRRLFALYPASDFEPDVASYEATRAAASDPAAPVHWFRVSRMLRDLLFTCSSIDFGYEMSRQSRKRAALGLGLGLGRGGGGHSFAGVRLYDLNQSMLTPLFRAMGMPYAGAVHGSDYNYLSNGVFPEGQVSARDEALSASMAASFIRFAYTGDPSGPDDDEAFGAWPEAFPGQDRDLEGAEPGGPVELTLQVIGGPLGTGPCTLGGKAAAGSAGPPVQEEKEEEEGSMQIPLGTDGVEFGQMTGSAALQQRTRELERQRLLERCAFVNSLTEKLDI